MADDAATDGQPWSETGSEAALSALVARLVVEAGEGKQSSDSYCQWSISVAVVAEAGQARGELVVTIAEASASTVGEAMHQDSPFDPEAVAMATRIMACFPGLPPTSWQVAPRHDHLCIHAQVEVGSVSALLVQGVGDADHLEGGQSVDQRPSHIVRETELVQSLVDGHVVRSMCGQVFVPTETGHKARRRSVCSRCVLVMSLARRVVEPPG